MTYTQPEVALILSIASICISLIVAMIALRQAKITENMLRLDLYNRRFAIYSDTLKLYQALLSHRYEYSKDDFMLLQERFIKSFRESLFLFDRKDAIYQLLDEIHTNTFKITGFSDAKEQFKTDPQEFIRVHQASIDALESIGGNIIKLEVAMGSYLNFHNIAS